MKRQHLTGRERTFAAHDIIVSKTDLDGRIVYANDVFLEISGFSEPELIGKPHSIIRHPLMPGCVFRLAWETIQRGEEIFAYVINRSKCGGHYWVFAHITPTFGADGSIVGYHSSRRCPRREAIEAIEPLYRELSDEEGRSPSREVGIRSSTLAFSNLLKSKGMTYGEFVFSL